MLDAMQWRASSQMDSLIAMHCEQIWLALEAQMPYYHRSKLLLARMCVCRRVLGAGQQLETEEIRGTLEFFDALLDSVCEYIGVQRVENVRKIHFARTSSQIFCLDGLDFSKSYPKRFKSLNIFGLKL
jgi:hypothetical protein